MAKSKDESGKKPAKKAATKKPAAKKKGIVKAIKDGAKAIKEKVTRKKTAVISKAEPVQEKEALAPVRGGNEEPNY